MKSFHESPRENRKYWHEAEECPTRWEYYTGVPLTSRSMDAQWVAMPPIIANRYVEHFEQEAMSPYPNLPKCWFRYVDDTFSKLYEYDEVKGFTEHLKSRDPYIKFTMEPASDGKFAFLDTYVHIKDKGSTKHIPPTYSHRSISKFWLQPSSGSQKVDS